MKVIRQQNEEELNQLRQNMVRIESSDNNEDTTNIELEQIQKELKKSKQQLELITFEKDDLMNRASYEAEELKETLKLLERQEGKNKAEIDNLTEENNRIRKEFADLQRATEELKNENSKKLEEQIMKERTEQLKKDLERENRAKKELNEFREGLEKNKEKLNEITSERDALIENLSRLKNMESVHQEDTKKITQLADLEKKKNQELQQTINQLQKELEILKSNKELVGVTQDEDEWKAIQNKKEDYFSQIELMLKEKENQLNSNNNSLQEKERQLNIRPMSLEEKEQKLHEVALSLEKKEQDIHNAALEKIEKESLQKCEKRSDRNSSRGKIGRV